MLFLVISDPVPTRSSDVTEQRQQYWKWIELLQQAGRVSWVYAKTGRGAVVLFDVDDNSMLHRYLNEWCNLIPARFDIHPLIDPAAAQRYLGQ